VPHLVLHSGKTQRPSAPLAAGGGPPTSTAQRLRCGSPATCCSQFLLPETSMEHRWHVYTPFWSGPDHHSSTDSEGGQGERPGRGLDGGGGGGGAGAAMVPENGDANSQDGGEKAQGATTMTGWRLLCVATPVPDAGDSTRRQHGEDSPASWRGEGKWG